MRSMAIAATAMRTGAIHTPAARSANMNANSKVMVKIGSMVTNSA